MWLFLAGVASAYVPAIIYIAYEAWRARKATRPSRFVDADGAEPRSRRVAALLPRFGRAAAEPSAETPGGEPQPNGKRDAPCRSTSEAEA